MKRLTDKRLAIPPGQRQEVTREKARQLKEIPVPSMRELYYRLSQIEDILGDEYDLDRLRELAEADREGRCVVLDDLTVADLWQMLTVLDSAHYGDGTETYTTGYRNGHRNGRIEILRHVLGICEGDSAEAETAISGT